MLRLLRTFISFWGRTDVFFYLLLWLMMLLVAGTLAQKDIGLFYAQKLYFSSFVIWVGDFVPMPGGYSTLAMISLGLLVKLLQEEWAWEKMGTIILHVGALLLLLGGFLTAEFSKEGSMVIAEGEANNIVQDYYKVELAISQDSQDIATFSESTLHQGNILQHNQLPFSLEIKQFCRNCQLVKRDSPQQENTHAMAKFFTLQSIPSFKEEESNISGVSFNISGEHEDVNGFYSLFESMPIEQTITINDQTYKLAIRHQRTYLPFSIHLNDFKKQTHPGTQTASSYHSDVVLSDNGTSWQSRIEMNAPLRYKGYTFYQASFIDAGEREFTELAVVHNIGRLFPYISSIIMCIGLLVHLIQRMPMLMKRKAS